VHHVVYDITLLVKSFQDRLVNSGDIKCDGNRYQKFKMSHNFLVYKPIFHLIEVLDAALEEEEIMIISKSLLERMLSRDQ
jgi:hypothetical protein